MGDRSLQSSIWAPGNGPNTISNGRPYSDDWTCSTCSFSNYQWRKQCFRCSTPIGIGSTTNIHTLNPSVSHKSIPNFISTEPHSPNLPTYQPTLKTVANGLATSRWAPRRQSRGEPVQVWTRTVSSTKPPRSRSSSPSKSLANRHAESLDLGLPYQVQHYILSLIQRIVEEGCFDFASRWLPHVLNERGWDCPEAVELSTWKSLLPTTLPPTVIKPLSNYSLEAALSDAVRTRNRAVHRHLCDNSEIRKMTLQAQDLMSMFSDTTRQGKFHQLWAELNAWNPKDDIEGARFRLERVLRSISERPMDDMDWTPNAISLQELSTDSKDIQCSPEHYADEMELD